MMASNVYSSGRMGVGEGLKRLTEKFQAGQIGDGAQSLNIYRENEETKGNSSSVQKIPIKRNPKNLAAQCTFGDL